MKIFVSSSAFGDLERIKEHYYVVLIIDHIQTLGDNPDIGRKVPEFDEEKIRELIRPPFRIVYLREEQSIRIIRVWRSERLLVLPEHGI